MQVHCLSTSLKPGPLLISRYQGPAPASPKVAFERAYTSLPYSVRSTGARVPTFGMLHHTSHAAFSHLICPTEREARVSLGAKDDGLEWVANKVLEETSSKNLIMKLASNGFIAYERKDNNFFNRQSFPALSDNVVDVTGAGDSLLAALAVGLSSGASLMKASAVAACMAALSVETLGNKPIELDALKEKIQEFY